MVHMIRYKHLVNYFLINSILNSKENDIYFSF